MWRESIKMWREMKQIKRESKANKAENKKNDIQMTFTKQKMKIFTIKTTETTLNASHSFQYIKNRYKFVPKVLEEAILRKDVEEVADDLSDGPRDDHGGEGPVAADGREAVAKHPEDRDAGEHLHKGRDDARAHKAKERMENLHVQSSA